VTDEEIYVLASDYESWSVECGVDVRNFDSLGFARAIEQASRSAVLGDAASLLAGMADESPAGGPYKAAWSHGADCIRALATDSATTNTGADHER
jgi:hypothetical protein